MRSGQGECIFRCKCPLFDSLLAQLETNSMMNGMLSQRRRKEKEEKKGRWDSRLSPREFDNLHFACTRRFEGRFDVYIVIRHVRWRANATERRTEHENARTSEMRDSRSRFSLHFHFPSDTRSIEEKRKKKQTKRTKKTKNARTSRGDLYDDRVHGPFDRCFFLFFFLNGQSHDSKSSAENHRSCGVNPVDQLELGANQFKVCEQC